MFDFRFLIFKFLKFKIDVGQNSLYPTVVKAQVLPHKAGQYALKINNIQCSSLFLFIIPYNLFIVPKQIF